MAEFSIQVDKVMAKVLDAQLEGGVAKEEIEVFLKEKAGVIIQGLL